MTFYASMQKESPKRSFTLKMRRTREAHLRELLFRVSILLKGLDGALEIAGGIALWAVSPGSIVRVVGLLTQDEIAEDPP